MILSVITVDLTLLIQAFIGFLATLITFKAIPLIRNKVSKDDLENIEKWVSIAVSAAEKIYQGSGQGTIKKDYVKAFLAEQGFIVDSAAITDELNALIEAAVYELKK